MPADQSAAAWDDHPVCRGRPGDAWWVGYTTLENGCDTTATLTGLEPAGSQPGSWLEWTTQTAARVLPDGAIPDAYLPGKSLSPTALEGYVIKPGQRVEVMAQIRIAGPKDASQRVPALRLSLTDPGGPGHLTLAPDIRLCTCNPVMRSASTGEGHDHSPKLFSMVPRT